MAFSLGRARSDKAMSASEADISNQISTSFSRAGQPHDLTFFDPPSIDRVMGVILELAAQLNEERYRRIALEELLSRRGLFTESELESISEEEPIQLRARSSLQVAVHDILLPIISDGHPSRPLRNAKERP